MKEHTIRSQEHREIPLPLDNESTLLFLQIIGIKTRKPNHPSLHPPLPTQDVKVMMVIKRARGLLKIRQPKRRVRFKDFKTGGPGDIRPFSILFQHISLKALIGKNQNFPFHLYAFSVSPMFSEVKTHLALHFV